MLRWSSSSATLPLAAVFARHIGCISVFWHFSQPRGYYDAFADAQASCSAGREWLFWLEGTAREAPRRCLVPTQDTKRLLDDDAAWLSLLQVWCVVTCSQDTGQLWFSSLCFFLHVVVFWFFEVGRGAAAALGCCAWGLPSKVTCGRVTKTHAAISFFSNFSGFDTRWLFAPRL